MAGVQRTFKQCKKIAVKNGFVCTRVNGDHYIYDRGLDRMVLTLKQNAVVFDKYIKKFNLVL